MKQVNTMRSLWRSYLEARKSWIPEILPHFLITMGIMSLTTLLALLFKQLLFTESNIIMVYILGVLLISRQTDGYLWGICAAVLGVLSFNFFFTEPLYTFMAYSSDYPITFGVMLIVALITSTLTTRVRREAKLSKLRERRSETLYGISRNLLTARSIDQIISTAAVNIANLCASSVVFYSAAEQRKLSEPYIYTFEEDTGAALLEEAQRNAAHRVFDTGMAVNSDVYYLPVEGRSRVLGVIGVLNPEQKLTEEQKALVGAISVQAALSIEREIYSNRQQQSKMEMESEKIRSNLLRAVSHDLRTPLTGILGAASTLTNDWDKIDDAGKKSLVSGVYDEAVWLNRCVGNILDITRIEDGRIEVKKSPEAVEEIIGEAVAIVRKHAGRHPIDVQIPNSLMLVPMDGNLMKQVLVNLIENAVKYTPDGSAIQVAACFEGADAVFTVSDSGSGIDAKDLPYIFDRFFTTDRGQYDRHKGMGLGLAICKSIVLAHNGTITAENAETGGAVFKFTIPRGDSEWISR